LLRSCGSSSVLLVGGIPPPKIPKIIKKGMLGLDLIWIRSGSGLDLVATVEG